MTYIILECEKSRTTAEYEFVNIIWHSEIAAGTVKIIRSSGNKNVKKELSDLLIKNNDSLYIHYDLVNTFEKQKSGILSAVLETIADISQFSRIQVYFFRYQSFEHMILMTSVIDSLVSYAKSMSQCHIKDSKQILEYSDCLEEIRYITSHNTFAFMNIQKSMTKYPLLFRDTVVTTREQYITHVCDQLSNIGQKFFHCSKAALGICWKEECTDMIHQPNCLHDKKEFFDTALCNSGSRSLSILNSLSLLTREQLYLKYNMNTPGQSEPEPVTTTNYFK